MKESCRLFRSRWKDAAGIVFVDLLFFSSMALVFYKIWSRVLVHMDGILAIMDANYAELAGEPTQQQMSSLMASHPEFMAHYQQITQYIGVLFVSALVLWCVFQGISWMMTHAAVGNKKESFFRFFGRFSALTLIWWVLFGLIVSLSIKMSFQASMAALPGVNNLLSTVLVYVLMFLLFYLAYTSYVLVPHHNVKWVFRATLKTAYKNFKTLAPACLAMILILLGEYLIFIRIMERSGYAAAVFGIALIFPTIAWTRFYAIKAVKKH